MYAYAPTINYVSKSSQTAKKQKPDYGKRLVARRAELDLSLADIERETNGVIYDQLLWRVENGGKLPDTLKISQRGALAKVLDWLPSELDRALGLLPPLAPSETPTTLEAIQRFEVQDTHITFRVYAGISAGHEEAEPIDGEAFSIPSGDLSGIDPVCVRVYRVNGDCMVSESARGLTMNICSGDKIAVDISQRIANNNDVIAAYWRPGDKLVVKRYVEAGDHIVLKPTSPTHPPLIAQNNDDFEIIGKVVWRGGPYRA